MRIWVLGKHWLVHSYVFYLSYSFADGWLVGCQLAEDVLDDEVGACNTKVALLDNQNFQVVFKGREELDEFLQEVVLVARTEYFSLDRKHLFNRMQIILLILLN